MQQMVLTSKEYALVLLKWNPDVQKENSQQIIWEHGRRNFQLRAEGLLSIVAPVTQQHDLAGIAIFTRMQ